MDCNTVAEGLLELAWAQGAELGGDLGRVERMLRELSHQVGARALEKHINEQRPGYEGSSRPCPRCEGRQRFVRMRPKVVVTRLGDARIERAYYRCDGCRCSSLPYDERQGLGRCAATAAVARMATWCAAHEPFEAAAEMLDEVGGVRLSGSTVHRLTLRVGEAAKRAEEAAASGAEPPAAEAEPERLSTAADGAMAHIDGRWQEVKVATCYWESAPGRDESRHVVRHESAEAFAPHAAALADRCGQKRARQKVLLGDGAKWVWQRVGGALDRRTVHITDWYHVMEHVWRCGHALHGEGSAEAGAWVEPIKAMLWDGELRRLRAHLEGQSAGAESEGDRRAIRELITYLVNQGDRLVYDDFRAAGYDIGSGRVESACKHVIAARAKRSGMQWSSRGFQATLSLRCAYLNGHADALWSRHPLATAA